MLAEPMRLYSGFCRAFERVTVVLDRDPTPPARMENGCDLAFFTEA